MANPTRMTQQEVEENVALAVNTGSRYQETAEGVRRARILSPGFCECPRALSSSALPRCRTWEVSPAQ